MFPFPCGVLFLQPLKETLFLGRAFFISPKTAKQVRIQAEHFLKEPVLLRTVHKQRQEKQKMIEKGYKGG